MSYSQMKNGFGKYTRPEDDAFAALAPLPRSWSTSPGSEPANHAQPHSPPPQSADVPFADIGKAEVAQAPEPSGDLTAGFADVELPQYNGNSRTTVSVARSGNQLIDGQLSGVRWNGAITYSDPDSASDYQSGYNSDSNNNGISAQNEGFSQLSAQQLRAMHFALNQATYNQPAGAGGYSVEGFTNLDIDYVGGGSGAATIRVANSSDPGTSYAYYPSASIYGGDSFIGTSARTPTIGNYSWYTTLHELGHSLGLAHGHTGGAYGALPSNVDSMEYSIMTYRSYIGADAKAVYNETWGFAQTFMMLDIAALQYMYGADFTSNSGNTVYTWSPTTGQSFVNGTLATDPGGNRIFMTVWDGGGYDTYNLSNYTTDQTIDLAPGGYSTFSAAQRANLGNSNIARGEVFNALLYNNDTRSLIEAAIGGSGSDTISGNAANNELTGNGGNDTLRGLDGDDTLNGGLGADMLVGGAGFDTASYASAAAAVTAVLFLPSVNAGEAQGDTYDSIEGLIGSSFDDNLQGDANANTIAGGAGSDLLFGHAGNDTLQGGDGLDHLWGGAGADILDGGAGFDFARYEYAGSAVTAVLFLPSVNTGEAAGDTYAGIEGLVGSGFDDNLQGDEGTNHLYGGAGIDLLFGRGGDDYLSGDADTDHLWGGTGADVLVGGAGFDYVRYDFASAGVSMSLADGGSAGEALGDAALGAEALVGSNFADTLTGNAGNNLLLGLGGDDILFGGQGTDDLVGGAGNDTFAFRASDFQAGVYDQVIDFHEVAGDFDALTILGVPQASLQITQQGGGVLISTAELGGSGGVYIQNFTLAQIQDQLFVV